MKSASKRQVKTPVGNKTKRGAELEGTPKTPSSIINGSSQHEQDDRRIQPRSRRPLQWNIISKQRNGGDDTMRQENTVHSSQQRTQLKYTGESKALTAALSPICVNAIHGSGAGHQGGRRITGMRKQNELPPALVSPFIKGCDGGADRKCHGKAEANAGSCPSSPDAPSSGKQLLFWSNAAFINEEAPEKNDRSEIKDAASCSSCSSSVSSSHEENSASTARAESEAESRLHETSAIRNASCEKTCNGRSEKGALILPKDRVVMDPVQGSSNLKLEAVEDMEWEHANACKNDLSDVSSRPKKDSLGCSESSLTAKYTLATGQAGHIEFPPYSSPATKQMQVCKNCGFGAGDVGENEEEAMKRGLNEIQQEIERLSERLSELRVQKRKREEELIKLQSQKQAKNAEKARQGKRAGGGGGGAAAGRMKEMNGASKYGVPSRFLEGSPLAATTERGSQGRPAAAASVSKVAEVRRSVSSTGRRMERINGDEHSKAFRRLSLSAATNSFSTSQQQETMKPINLGKSTPSRLVSSRYGRAITTPDACAPFSKKGDRPSSSCALAVCPSPLPAQPQFSPSPSTSLTCSPLKRAATFRSRYLSRSGLSYSTPIKDQQPFIKPVAMLSSSAQKLPSSTLSSSLTPPRCVSPLPRLDSPKSTEALYKCLESLLEDSKHLFKRGSSTSSAHCRSAQAAVHM